MLLIKSKSRINVIRKTDIVYTTGNPTRDSELHLYARLDPGEYILLIGTYVADMFGSFELAIDSSGVDVSIEQIWPAIPKEKKKKGLLGRFFSKKLEKHKQKLKELGIDVKIESGKVAPDFENAHTSSEKEIDEEARLLNQRVIQNMQEDQARRDMAEAVSGKNLVERRLT